MHAGTPGASGVWVGWVDGRGRGGLHRNRLGRSAAGRVSAIGASPLPRGGTPGPRREATAAGTERSLRAPHTACPPRRLGLPPTPGPIPVPPRSGSHRGGQARGAAEHARAGRGPRGLGLSRAAGWSPGARHRLDRTPPASSASPPARRPNGSSSGSSESASSRRSTWPGSGVVCPATRGSSTRRCGASPGGPAPRSIPMGSPRRPASRCGRDHRRPPSCTCSPARAAAISFGFTACTVDIPSWVTASRATGGPGGGASMLLHVEAPAPPPPRGRRASAHGAAAADLRPAEWGRRTPA